MKVPSYGASRLQTQGAASCLGISCSDPCLDQLNSLGLCFLTHENYTSCSDTQTAKRALRSALGSKAPKRRSTINIRSINSNGDDCNNLTSLEVSCGAFSSLAFILAT